MTVHAKDYDKMRPRTTSSAMGYLNAILLCSLLLVMLSQSEDRAFIDHSSVSRNITTIQTASAYMFKSRNERRRNFGGSSSISVPTTTFRTGHRPSPSPLSSSSSPSTTDLATTFSPNVWIHQLKVGYDRRVAADPNFPSKSITEVLLAATTQLMAEWNRRGADRLLLEFDFVFPAILAAVFGKYYRNYIFHVPSSPEVIRTILQKALEACLAADIKINRLVLILFIFLLAVSPLSPWIHIDLHSMWRVARTLDDMTANSSTGTNESSNDVLLFGKMKVPTNAFQPYLLDGITRPTIIQRLGSFLAPVGPLFRAGMISSAVGYSMGALLFQIRSILVPDFVPVTVPINILHACVYTGCFMAVVSNIRYQILQGLIEPCIDKFFASAPLLRSVMIFVIRYLNGLLGSILAISGMRFFGLQKLK